MALNKRFLLVGCALLLVLLFAYFLVFGLRTTRIETVRRQVNQGLAIGATLNDVSRFLDLNHFEHSELVRPPVMSIHGHDYSNALVVAAIRRDTWRSLLYREDVQLVFVFDEGHKLTRIDIFPRYKGL